MNEMLQNIKDQVVVFGPSLLAGLGVLIVGWLVALFAAFVVRKFLARTTVDNKLANWMNNSKGKTAAPIGHWAGKAVFYLIMLVVMIAFFATIQLTIVTEPLNAVLQPFLAYLPRLAGATVLFLVAWVLATVVKKVITGILKRTKLDEKLGGAAGADTRTVPLSKTFSDLAYWLVFLFFLPLILQTLDLQGLLAPVTLMFNKVFAFLPNIIAAAAIAAIGWFVARVVQRITEGLLAGVGLDRLSEKWGMKASLGKQKLSGVLSMVLYFVILVPVLISALAALQLDAVTKPASDMLGKIMSALPNIIGASLVVLLAAIIGKVVSGFVSNLLAGLGFNNVLVKLGLARQPPQGRNTPSAVIGIVIMSLIILFASVSAADMLGFPAVGALVQDFIKFAGHIVMATVIFGLGLLLAQVIGKGIRASDSPNARRLALAARVVILALAGAMALRQTGLADEIINLAFGLTLGAAAVAFALAFGLGGRDIAGKTLEDWRSTIRHNGPRAEFSTTVKRQTTPQA